MRAGVWCAATLSLLAAVAGSALRPTQVESGIRTGRRFSQRPESNGLVSSSRPEDGEATSIRPRSSRRREEQFEREVSRKRTRSRNTESVVPAPSEDNVQAKTQTERNERFNSRRTYNRTRNRPNNQIESKTETTSSPFVTNARSRSRQFSRRGPIPTPSAPPYIDESKLEVINSNLDDITKMTFNETTVPTSQFRRKSSTAFVPTEASKRVRSRPHTRVENVNDAVDLASSGTTNSISVSEKEPTTSRIVEDIRSSRKLRYKTRLSETDTNLTGQGLAVSTEPKSSQNIENVASQPEFRTSKPVVVSDSTETVKETTTLKRKKVVRRPLHRSGAAKKTVAPLPLKSKSDDEIGEDDNYPESFKALLQAKNASTHTDSQSSESLSVKASQKIYNTYTSSPLTVISETDNAQNKSLFRHKPISEVTSEKAETSTTQKPKENVEPEEKKVERKLYKRPENKPRPTFAPRNRKANVLNTTNNTTPGSSEKPVYKFNRKFKVTTTESPGTENIKRKRLQSNNLFKKPLVRPSYYSRSRNSNRSDITSTEKNLEVVTPETVHQSITVKTTTKEFLPRTSYYSRLRANQNNITESSKEDKISEERKDEPSFEKPNIYTSVTSSVNDNSVDSHTEQNKDTEEIFVIAVTSKESIDKNPENNSLNSERDNQNIQVTRYYIPTTAKYHASYKDLNTVSEGSEDEEIMVTSAPPIRNIKSRNYARSRKPGREPNDISIDTYSPTSEVNIKSISESYSKTSPASSNGITSEPEKSKGRFSSKYRASYLDTKPFYKATVPTVTPSTAWLKFFVTDRELIKSVQEPLWFDGDAFVEATTESLPRQTIFQTSPIIHESPIELVEGEEIQLGPDMNAISFTQTRRTLSSADLRLSESVAKPSHTMNVEASNHSPSVTVSIYDALADILTSTPRPQLSSTTEVLPKLNTNIDVKQTLNGVSSNINVNTVRDLSSQNTSMSVSSDIITDTKLVQITGQTIPTTVINRMPVGESVTSSSNEENPMNLPSSTPIPSPTTPLSARRPFAIKVLYTATELPPDMTTTTNKPSTDNPTTVHNTVSIVSDSNLVSSELTSMLSNNIRDLLQNMDENSRSKVSVEMANLLKNLIPRAVSGMSSRVEIIPETTPYSLEDIRDTEILMNEDNDELSDKITNTLRTDPIQTVIDVKNVNITEIKDTTEKITTVMEQSTSESVNNFDISNLLRDSGSASTSQTTLINIPVTTPLVTVLTTNVTPKYDTTTLTGLVDNDTVVVDSEINMNSSDFLGTDVKATNNDQVLPIPFFTNAKISDFTLGELGKLNDFETSTPTQSVPLLTITSIPDPFSPQPELENFVSSDPSKVSPLQLWVLSKKASVLKMIEDLLRQHKEELALAPSLTDTINTPVQNSVSVSSRLTEIMNNMNTTNPIDVSDLSEMITNMTTTSSISLETTTPLSIPRTSSEPEIFPSLAPENAPTSRMSSQDISVTLDEAVRSLLDSTTPQITTVATTIQKEITTAVMTTEVSEDKEQSTEISKVTTTVAPTDITTQTDLDTTNQNDITTTDQSEMQTTAKPRNQLQENTTLLTDVTGNNNTQILLGPPKKDYVIFGILPNNTVVRKDPNDDVLESLTEASPYIVYGVLPNNTIIRKFPNGTRVPRVMQKIDILPISPSSLRNPYSPIHNNPAIVRPQSNPIRVSTNVMTSTDTNNGTENRLTSDTVNNQQIMISSSTLNVKDKNMLGFVTTTYRPPAEKSTASHVLSLRTTTMLPSIDEILLNSISSAAKEEIAISSMTSSTSEPRILTLDIDPETKQIRTEKPGDENMNAIFKFIPIDEVASVPENKNANVLKLATKSVLTSTITEMTETPAVTDASTQTSQIQMSSEVDLTDDPTTTTQINVATPLETGSENPSQMYITTEQNNPVLTTAESTTLPPITNVPTTIKITTEQTTSTTEPTTTTTTTEASTTTTTGTEAITTFTTMPTTTVQTTTTLVSTTNSDEELKKYQEDAQLLQTLLQLTGRSAENVNIFTNNKLVPSQKLITTTTVPTTTRQPKINVNNNGDSEKLLQTLLQATGQSIPNLRTQQGDTTTTSSTTKRTIEDDIKQFEEDTKLLKALLAATGQDPAKFNIPTLNNIITTPKTTQIPTTTPISITNKPKTTTPSIEEDLRKLQEEAKLLQVLLQATGQNPNSLNLPIISSATSNVRMASKLLTTPVVSKMTTEMPNRPVFVSGITIESPVLTTVAPTTTFQPKEPTTTENIGISTTYAPFTNQRRRIVATTMATPESTTERSYTRTTAVPTARIAPIGFKPTTEVPTSSTFSVEEDVAFLNNLKSVLNTNNIEDPETALANRIIALAVEKSLNEITSTTKSNEVRDGKSIGIAVANRIQTTAQPITTTTKPTTTTPKPTTSTLSTPSIEEDIKQFQEDTKLLQALLKATGQDPTKFNIPTIKSASTDVRLSPNKPSKPTKDDIKLLSNLLASPEIVTKPAIKTTTKTRPFGARIAIKDDVKSIEDDAKFLQTLIKLQGVQETTTQKPKLTITGQTPDVALKLLQKTKSTGTMVSEATHAPMSLSTEYGKSQDALLAALLKEQGFGPTTASSLDEQLRLAALLNQVVVTPKARRTTTTPLPPPPPQRRPVLDGLAWLWQQWRETSPGPGGARPNRRPSAAPSVASSTSNRVSWFGSGPFVGNADDHSSTSNRIPLEPPAVVVASQQPPGQRPLVSAAINMTRAMSQFLGAAIQGAAQTVQNVIRAGQRAASDAYVNGSG